MMTMASGLLAWFIIGQCLAGLVIGIGYGLWTCWSLLVRHDELNVNGWVDRPVPTMWIYIPCIFFFWTMVLGAILATMPLALLGALKIEESRHRGLTMEGDGGDHAT